MNFYRGVHNLSLPTSGSIVAIGNFDGVHLGHQAILRLIHQISAERGLQSIVLMFEPQPMEFFRGEAAPARLTRLREKLFLFSQFKIDNVVCLTFNRALARMTAEEFTRNILLKKLRALTVIIGEDFRFGYDRACGLSELITIGRQQGFNVELASTCILNNRRISSSWVRSALANGDLEMVFQLLGRFYSLTGRVTHGEQRGRQLGFPTANVPLGRRISPVQGVFASRVVIDHQEVTDAVTNIGRRPMFGGGPVLLETHLLEGDWDLYGRLIRVELHKHLRGERTFASISQLKQQMTRDLEATRQYFQD